MQAMSEGMAALLKSGRMIGDNRPSHEITIGDGNINGVYPYDGETFLANRCGYDDGSTNYYLREVSNFVVGADGKEFCVIRNINTDEFYLGHMDANEDYLTKDVPVTSVTALGIYNAGWGDAYGSGNKHSLFKRSDGKVLLFTIEKIAIGTPCRVKCYISNNGLGTDFTLLSTVYEGYPPPSGATLSGFYYFVSNCRQDSSGNLWIIAIIDWDYDNAHEYYFGRKTTCFKSTDNGATWVLKHSYANLTFGTVHASSMVILPNNELIYSELEGSNNTRFYSSKDGGETWSRSASLNLKYDNLGYYTETIIATNFWETDAIYNNGVLYRWMANVECIAVMYNPTVDKILNNNDFDAIWQMNILAYNGGPQTLNISGYIDINYNNHFLLCNNDYTDLIISINFPKAPLLAKQINISRAKGMAGSLTVEFDNKNGILAPDGLDNPQLLWPNKEITVKQGYGAELIQTFKGLIDTISMSTFPQSISINARDKMKALLDHYVRDSSFNYVVKYENQTIEAIWQDLITKAGLTYGTVETTGITLTEKVFSWQTYADCVSWLDEIAGFETYCDEFGVMHFVYDGRPAVVTTAYQFVEGVDIIQLGYDIDDKDLYYSVVVYGKDANDAVIYYAATLPQAVYWNIPSGKVMRIDAPDADTSAKCQAIAEKAIYLMQTRARQVRFSTIGIPHLQRGDFIQVTEASSTISEIYRITDISTSQGPDGYTMELTCYYHAAPEV